MISSISKRTADLAKCLELELLLWAPRMAADTVRALALDCHPWHEASYTLSFLTGRESFDEKQYGKWSLASWRLYDFPSTPAAPWPTAAAVMREAFEYYSTASAKPDALAEIIQSAVYALRSPNIASALAKYSLAHDFEIFVGQPDQPGRNYAVKARMKDEG